MVYVAAEACDPPDNTEGKDDDGIYEWVGYHAKGPPFLARVNDLHSLGLPVAVKSDFPPVLWADGNHASRPEEKRDVGEDGHKQCNPKPDVFSGNPFCIVSLSVTNPAPVRCRGFVVVRTASVDRYTYGDEENNK